MYLDALTRTLLPAGDPSSDSRKTQATGSVHVNPPIYVVSPESSTTWKTDDCSYERLKNEFHNPAAYGTWNIEIQKCQHLGGFALNLTILFYSF